jgi:hypothetical protein
MKTRSAIITFLLLGLSFIFTNPALAKGQPEKISVDGPDLTTEIAVEDPSVLESLGMSYFENLDRPIDPPQINGPVYLITRYTRDGESYTPYDRLLYVPHPEGEAGAIYYLGIHNGYGPYDGKWYAASELSERALLALLGERGAPQFKTDGAESASPSFQDRNWGFGAIALVFGVLLTAGLIVQTRAQEHNHQSS